MNSIAQRGAVAAACLLAAQSAFAGDVIAVQEYDKYIDKHRTVQALDSSLFGEQISARDGTVTFKMVDGELAGNGPTMRIVRSFTPRENNRYYETSGMSVAGWILEIPRMKTVVNYSVNTSASSPYGWQVAGSNRNARCSQFGAPGPVVLSPSYLYWDDHEWWSGYQLVDDAGNEQQVLATTDPALIAGGYKAVTAGNWRISCLSSITGGSGEGFLATSPDGTKYWFDYLVYALADAIVKPIDSAPESKQAGLRAKTTSTLAPVQNRMTRKNAMLLVTRIEDRFGNWLTYNYNASLGPVGITASDGRTQVWSDVNGVTTISLGGAGKTRSWSYEHVSGVGTVTLPDSTPTNPVKWTYNFAPLTTLVTSTASYGAGSCAIPTGSISGSAQATATSPSGVTGTFAFTLKRFGRSYVPYECVLALGGDDHVLYPPTYVKYALTQRSFTGPGLVTQSWTYAYSTPNASYSKDCGSGCTTEVWSDVTDPEGTRQRSVFSNRYDGTENVLLREETYNASNTLMRKVSHEYAVFPAYATSSPFPWPAQVGDDLQLRTNKARSERWAPATKHQTDQQGRLFTWDVANTCGSGGASLCFDALARPTKVTKSSAGP